MDGYTPIYDTQTGSGSGYWIPLDDRAASLSSKSCWCYFVLLVLPVEVPYTDLEWRALTHRT